MWQANRIAGMEAEVCMGNVGWGECGAEVCVGNVGWEGCGIGVWVGNVGWEAEKRSKTAEKGPDHRGRGENDLFWWFCITQSVIPGKVLWGGGGRSRGTGTTLP